MTVSCYGTDIAKLDLTDEIESRVRLTKQELRAMKNIVVAVLYAAGDARSPSRKAELTLLADTLRDVIGRIEARAYRRYA